MIKISCSNDSKENEKKYCVLIPGSNKLKRDFKIFDTKEETEKFIEEDLKEKPILLVWDYSVIYGSFMEIEK